MPTTGALDALDTVRSYAEAVFRRAREPMEPRNYEIDWDDQPSRHKTYPGSYRVPLPPVRTGLATLRQLLTGEEPDAQPWSLDRLATLLRLSYGVLDRRLNVNWNQDLHKRVFFPHAVWGRGTASGGGMYPVEIYWVAGPSGPLVPGVYHYATGHHALHRLVVGDLTPVVRAALGGRDRGDQFLLATIRFWKNSFKYNSFCYHVVTQDLGAMLGSWDLLGRAMGTPVRRHLSFDVEKLDALLGLDSEAESVFAVLPLPWEGTAAEDGPPSHTLDVPGDLITYSAFERSRTIRTFPQVIAVHRAAMADTDPDPAAVRAAAPTDLPGAPVALPEPELARLDRPMSAVIGSRASSFGRFRRPPEMTAEQLATTLKVAAASRRYAADVKPADDPPPLTRLWAFVNHVEGLAPGTYAYRERDHALLPVKPAPEPDMSTFLQHNYFLTNYAMNQVGAVVAISGRLDAVLSAFGSRGYRILNAEVGTVAQAVYCAAAALGIGCGAVLGFDNVGMNEALGIDGSDEQTMLFVLLGREPAHPADLSYRMW
ncbi:MAG TPA: SagB family peptide dehydrogenase [Micromonosporaceae bacterium]